MIGPLRVLLTTDAVGGVWRYTVDLAAGLDAAGHACLVLGAGPEPDQAQRAECGAWRRSRLTWTPYALDWTDQTYEARAAQANLEAHARHWRADVVHLHLPSQADSLPRDVTVVAVAHSCHPTWWRAAGQGPMPHAWRQSFERNRAGLSRADRIIAPSRAHADALRAVYGPLDRLTVIHNAAGPPEPPATKQPTILAAGRWWDTAKNARTLDQAARDLTWPVAFAGPLTAPEGAKFTPVHARSIGNLTSAELRRQLAMAAIFVSPSLYEPFGLAVLEAAAHRCALVLADIPTFRELWTGAALFADPRDPACFARAIESLATDEPRRHHLAQAAEQTARRFTHERQRRAILAAYEQLLSVAA